MKDYIKGVDNLAKEIGLSPATIRRLVQRKKLPCTRITRLYMFDREAVQRALDRFELKAVGDE